MRDESSRSGRIGFLGRVRAALRRRPRPGESPGSDESIGLDESIGPDDRGATTAEFAIVTMAAVGFAGLLVVILRSDQVRAILEDLVQRALSTGG